jgi:signal transduction histidine kinase/ligand-binding sensor domain-containing protein
MLQDSTGYLWIGTQHGLYRYDGAHFLTFEMRDGLPSARIESLYETPDHVLWAGTSAGLARRAGSRFQYVDVGRPIEIVGRSAIASDHAGRILVSSSGGLLIGNLTTTGYRFVPAPQIPGVDPAVHGIHVSPDGVVWFGCGRQICRLESNRVTALSQEVGIPLDRWDALITDNEGTLWIRSSTRLLRRAPSATRFEPAEVQIPDNSDFAALSLGRNGELFVPTDFGVTMRAGGKWRFIAKAQGLPADPTSSVLVDHEGSIWIGLLGFGVARWLGYQQWESWTSADGLSNDTIWGIQRDANQDLWIGTDLGINRLHIGPDGKPNWRVWTERQGINGNKVRCVLKSSDGTIWTGSSPGGVSRLDPKTGAVTSYDARDGITNDRITKLKLDETGGLWVGTRGGIFHGVTQGRRLHFERVQLPSSTPDEIFFDGMADRQGRFWLGGSRGLLVLEKGHWRRFTTKDGPPTNYLGYITEAKDDSIWIGYREPYGVSRITLDAGGHLGIRTFTEKDGLGSEKALFVGADLGGRIWFGHDRGVDAYNGVRWHHYDQQDGLIWDDCDAASFLADPDGSVWIGTSGGLSHFRPGPSVVAAPPTVEITEANIGGHPIDVSQPVSVRHGHAPLLAFFAALTFLDERTVRSRYRLAGFADEWVETSLRQLEYANLPPGRYTLEVEARTADGEWNQNPARMSIEVLPLWWETWWARLGVLAVLLLAVWAYIWSRERRYRKEQQRLESAVDQRTHELRLEKARIERKNADIQLLLKDSQEANRLKSEFLANVSHEIRTPMNGVLGMTALALETQLDGEQREYLETAQQSATSLLSLLNEILDFSKIDAGRLELESVPFSPAECMRDAVKTLAGTVHQKGLQIQSAISADVPENLLGDPTRLRQVLLNLIGNAVKFTDLGSIFIEAVVDQSTESEITLLFSVKDTGIGIPADKKGFIFEAFRQADGSTTRKHGGTGLGLAICSRLVEMMGGRIWVESSVGDGSTFFFTGVFRVINPSATQHNSQLATSLPRASQSGNPTPPVAADDQIQLRSQSDATSTSSTMKSAVPSTPASNI